MSVIIRLQNLPWTANARDIRNFFTGLSIPEGGVHIIGGEMGDAFIAFSTDEDARCAMLKDREKLMEIQVRLLLSSRAEMQKVIETARLASTVAAAAAVATPTPVAELTKPRPPTVVAPAVAMPAVPQPPIIGGLSGFLLDPQQQALAKQQLVPPVAATPSFLAYQQQAGITLADVGGVSGVGLGHKATTLDRHSPEQGYFSSRRRQSRSRSLSRSSSSEDSDRSRDRDPRYRSRKRRPDVRSDSSERELKLKPQPVAAPVANNIMPWAAGVVPGVAPAAAPPAMVPVPVPVPGLGNMPGLQQQLSFMSVLPPVLQSYSTTTNTSTTNNYNLNTAVPPQQQQPLQPQYPVIPDVGVVVNKQVTQKQQEPIAFANVNPYAQIYPQLFQQQQQLLLQQQTAKTASGLANSPGSGGGGGSGAATAAGGVGAATGSMAAGGVGANSLSGGAPIAETCYIKISGMCPTTSYSDLRKYFAGLYIPHNGIKIINGANGVRTGIAYIEFSRVSSAQKALSRNNTMFRDRLVQIAPVGDEEFEQAEELVQRSAAEHNHSRGGGRGGGGGNGNGGGGVDDRSTSGAGSTALSASAAVDLPPTCVLFVEDLPQLTTEQDIMKMFSELYTVVDILLTPSPKNRRESVAYVLFARENEARSALENTARHYIGFRKLRVHASNQLIMQAARDKMRRASEQLLKEEQQQREDAEREALQQQLQQQQQQQQLQLQLEQQQELLAKQNSDPRRRNNDPLQQQQINNNSNNNLQPFGNPGMHNGNNNMPFAFQQQQQQQQNNNNNNNGMGMHNNNNNMGPFGMPHNNNNQQMQHPHQGNPQRREDVFVRVHNCEYGTRVNDLGELFVSEQLRIEHIEMLFNERNQSAGEFIVEFCDTQSAEMAMRLFHNRRFRGRGLRIVTITPQEIADRMKKPFMDYLPRTNAARPGADADADALPPQQQQQQQSQPQQQQQQQQSTRRRGPSRFDNDSSRNNNNFGNQQPQQQQSLPPPSNDNGDNNNSSKQQQHFNPFAVRTGPEMGMDDMAASSPKLGPINPINNNNNNDVDNDGIPDKFNRPGCVVAMRNVPFKADLKDILRFFSDYKLSPDDIIRRFRDDGKPTGDARVAFESPSEARSAFESRRRKLIFNRNVVLEII